MSTARRSILPLLMATATLSACSSGSSSGVEASCIPPETTVTPAQATPGQSVHVKTVFMWSGCDDQGTGDHGHALQGQTLTWRESTESTELTRVDADPTTGEGRATVKIPAAATPGTAEIQVGDSSVATITVLASTSTPSALHS